MLLNIVQLWLFACSSFSACIMMCIHVYDIWIYIWLHVKATACHSLNVEVREQPQGFISALNLWEPGLLALQHYVQPEISGKSLLPLPSPLLVEALELQVRFQVCSRNSNQSPLLVLVHVYFSNCYKWSIEEGFLTWIGLYSIPHFKIYICKNPVWWQWFTW